MKVAIFQSLEYDWMQVVDNYDNLIKCKDKYVLISNVVEVEFEIIDDDATKNAIKARSIKAAQKSVKTAQGKLDKLL